VSCEHSLIFPLFKIDYFKNIYIYIYFKIDKKNAKVALRNVKTHNVDFVKDNFGRVGPKIIST